MNEQRLIALEEQLAHQEHTLQDLNDALLAQQRRLDQLQAQCRRLEQRLVSLAERLPDDPDAGEPPPHY